MYNHALQTAAAINVMETARRILGHAVGVPSRDVDRMFDVSRCGGGPRTARTGMIRYALRLVELQAEMTDERLPLPVIPCVDVANLRVSHTTCTGRTGIGVADGRASMTRAEPLDAESPRDIALWLLLDARLASDRIFEHANVFGQDTTARRGRHGVVAEDGTTLDRLRLLEGIAVLVERGVTMEGACSMARRRGLPADPETVLAELESRRIGLWLQNRPWCQAAWRILTAQDPDCRYTNTDIPDWARAAHAAMRSATDDGRRSGLASLATAKPPAAAAAVDEPMADWERELVEGAS